MATGEAWTVSNPLKPTPWAWFDDNEEAQRIPLNIVSWLADKGGTYYAHTVTTDPELECLNPTTGHDAGVIGVWITKASAATLVIGKKYKFTIVVEATLADGTVKEPLTLFLKIRAK
jgi:hypothetical protein